MKGVSVIVCCYNSRLRLPQTLAHLAKQVVPEDLGWEIIIVDNNSTDNTAELAIKEWEKLPVRNVPLKTVHQPLAGLTYAREAGIEISRFDVIIFCDDDNWLCPTYVRDGYELLRSHAEIGAVGGQGIAISDNEFPHWFAIYQGYYACVPQGVDQADVTSDRGYLFGAGLVIRRQALESIKMLRGTTILRDRTGNVLSSGGDVELCYQLRLKKWRLWYSPHLAFQHYIPKERLSYGYLYKLVRGISRSGIYLNPYLYLLSGRTLNFGNYLKDLTHYGLRLLASLRIRIFSDSLNSRLQLIISWHSFLSFGCDFRNQFRNHYALKKQLEIS